MYVDEPLNFDVGLIQLGFHTCSSVLTQCMQVFSMQMLQHFSEIALSVCTLVLFILFCDSYKTAYALYIYIYCTPDYSHYTFKIKFMSFLK